ncbi:hypothetical protein [Rivularia sp. PCC 7116]|uniref:hypothetical protein n=1 Tax=Rivularia sp. PCC 7116 TaxID=373994 RepID=UPI0012F8F29E|nr:hypothetical protein [Rivularia sp. PCC 7116]
MPNYQLPTTKTVEHENKCYELLKRVINTQRNIGECFLWIIEFPSLVLVFTQTGSECT